MRDALSSCIFLYEKGVEVPHRLSVGIEHRLGNGENDLAHRFTDV